VPQYLLLISFHQQLSHYLSTAQRKIGS